MSVVKAYGLAVVLVIGGGAVSKWLDASAGAALVAAGAFLFGWVQRQPRFAWGDKDRRRKEHSEAKTPTEGLR